MNDEKDKTLNQETENIETPQIVIPKIEDTNVSTPQDNKPQVIEVKKQEEVAKSVVTNKETNNINNIVENKKTINSKDKNGHPVFLILLIILLFAFVYFLPDITKFITDYKNEKNGINELKSGTMTCSFTNSTNSIDYTYKLTLNYQKNRLKKSTMVTTNRLSDNATNNSILTEKENSCQLLKTVLDENNIGMTASCSVSAAVQITTQNIDYEQLDLNFITANIAEFEGFYPEYELNQSVTTIENELENNGYICERNEQ